MPNWPLINKFDQVAEGTIGFQIVAQGLLFVNSVGVSAAIFCDTDHAAVL